MFFGKYPARFYTRVPTIKNINKSQFEALERFRIELRDNFFSFEEAACLCGERKGMLIATRDRYALSVNTYLCKSCGILWTNPQMTEESLRKFYEKNYRPIYVGEDMASETFFLEQIQHGKSILSYLCRYNNELHNELGVVFDVGCGSGGVLAPFRDAGFEVYGCDHGKKYLEYGKSQGLTLEHGGGEVLSQYGKAKLIILSHVLEHFKNPKKELELLSYLLDDDGYIYIELPGVFNIHNAYKDPLLFLQNAHLFHYTLDTLTVFMSQVGFKLVAGNQYICAVYQKKSVLPLRLCRLEYMKILFYFCGIEIGRLKYLRSFPSYASRLVS
jgi:SAM-dependent methyltransferase